jgi:thiamine-phosphate pyrophosphorylase
VQCQVMAITDRRRLGLPVGADAGEIVGRLGAFAAAAGLAGVDLLQLRERDLPDGMLLRCARAMVEATSGMPVRVLVNDRAHVVRPAGAAGVHLRATSLPPDRLNAILGPGAIVGQSVHDGDGLSVDQTKGVHYLLLGTVFPSSSKPVGHGAVGLGALASLCARVGCPVLAVGGITPERCHDVRDAGAAGIAAIGMFMDAFRQGPARLGEVVAQVREAFAQVDTWQ